MALRQCVIKGFNTKNSEGAQSSRRRCAKPASRHFVECGGWPPPFTAKCRVPTDRPHARPPAITTKSVATMQLDVVKTSVR